MKNQTSHWDFEPISHYVGGVERFYSIKNGSIYPKQTDCNFGEGIVMQSAPNAWKKNSTPFQKKTKKKY